jgi:hypothetical protein
MISPGGKTRFIANIAKELSIYVSLSWNMVYTTAEFNQFWVAAVLGFFLLFG